MDRALLGHFANQDYRGRHGLNVVALLIAMATSAGAAGFGTVSSLMDLSIEELLEVEVVSASRKRESRTQASAAVHVLTSDDIRRSGARSIPDALRLVPGVQVARTQSSQWAVTARGFNSRTANKLLVLVDGRTVYSSFFSGVMWEVNDLILEDIDRIEVIRGPGAALWGSNTVNGIINIITKHTDDTQGVLVTGGAGSEEFGAVTARYGWRNGVNASYRAYAKYSDRDGAVDAAEIATPDAWDILRAGFRLDLSVSDRERFQISLDGHTGHLDQLANIPTLTPPYQIPYNTSGDFSGASLLGRWEKEMSDESDIQVQFYYDRSERDDSLWIETRDVFDLDVTQRFSPEPRSEVVWGVNVRYTGEIVEDSPVAKLEPKAAGYNLFSVFIEDETAVVKDHLWVSAGVKLERNEYTNMVVQPSARFTLMPTPRHTLWGAISRAARMPGRVERDAELLFLTIPPNSGLLNPSDLPVAMSVHGNERFESEHVTATEFGYRVLPTGNVSVDLATFYNRYSDLRTADVAPGYTVEGDPTHTHVDLPLVNALTGTSYGAELAVDWVVRSGFRLRGAYTYFHLETSRDLRLGQMSAPGGQIHDPEHQGSMWVSADLPMSTECDLVARYVGEIDEIGVDSYLTADARLGWRPTDRYEVFVIGRDLLQSSHEEFAAGVESITHASSFIQRSVFAGVALRF